MMRIIFLVALVLSGCATTAKYEKMLQTWVGMDQEQLVSSWGYPTQTTTAPNGNKLLVYSKEWSTTYVPVQFNQQPQETATYRRNYDGTVTEERYRKPSQEPIVTQHSCTTFFEIDSKNKITRWSWRGTDCVAQ